MTQGIASNGFFVFAPFPASDAFASFLLGFPVVFFQGGGDMNRGLRNTDFALFAQDDWRVTPRLTLNYGVRWEVSTPFTDIRKRMNAWAPGQKSKVFPTARRACCSRRSRRGRRNRAGLLEGSDASHRARVGSHRQWNHFDSRSIRNVL